MKTHNTDQNWDTSELISISLSISFMTDFSWQKWTFMLTYLVSPSGCSQTVLAQRLDGVFVSNSNSVVICIITEIQQLEGSQGDDWNVSLSAYVWPVMTRVVVFGYQPVGIVTKSWLKLKLLAVSLNLFGVECWMWCLRWASQSYQGASW